LGKSCASNKDFENESRGGIVRGQENLRLTH
jgi:hypothetical protein